MGMDNMIGLKSIFRISDADRPFSYKISIFALDKINEYGEDN